MKFLLDANTIILLLSGASPTLYMRAGACDEGDLTMSSIAFAEVALGMTAGKPPPIERLDRLLTQVALLPFDEAAARAYATLPFRRGSFGRLIAAHALALDLTLVTSNVRDFADLPGLRVEDWTAA